MVNWPTIIADLEKHMSHSQIAEAVGMSGSGHVHNLKSGRQKTVTYDVGCRLVELHRKVMRKARRQVSAAPAAKSRAGASPPSLPLTARGPRAAISHKGRTR